MAETSFEVKYDGEALRDGRMAVRDLAPALLALGEVFRQAGAVLYPDLPAPSLEIEATEEGSFDVALVLSAPDVWNQVANLLTGQGTTALANLEALIFGGAASYGAANGLYRFFLRLAGRSIERTEPTDDPDQMRVILDDETVIEAPAGTVRLYRNPKIRRSVKDSIAPVRQSGVERVEFRSDPLTDEPVVVEAADAASFDLPLEIDGEELVDDESEAVVTIVKTDFGDGRWKVNDGTSTFGVEMEDEGFRERIDRGEPFRKGDLLRCRLRTIQTTREGKLEKDVRVVEVIEHIKSGEQLDFDGEHAQD